MDTTAPSTGAAVQPAHAQGYIHMHMCTYTCIYIHTYLRRGSPWALRRKAGRSRLDARLWLSTSGLEPRTSERRVQGTGHREGYVCGARTEDCERGKKGRGEERRGEQLQPWVRAQGW